LYGDIFDRIALITRQISFLHSAPEWQKKLHAVSNNRLTLTIQPNVKDSIFRAIHFQ